MIAIMKKEEKERLREFVSIKGTTIQGLEKMIGKSNGYLNNVKSLSSAVIGDIVRVYPDLNADWLITGEGEPVKVDVGNDVPSQSEQAPTVPCVNAFVIGGSLSEQIDGGNINTLDRVITPVGGAEMAIEVSGDSMEPEYPKGARLFCRRIDDLSFIEWGKVYVLDTTQGAIVKEIQPGENEGTFTCKSINAKRYKPFEIPVSSVRGLWRILAVLILK